MTNENDSDTESNNEKIPSKKNKVKKKKGPLRTEAIAFVLILSSLSYAYGYFFLDNHLKMAMEFGASKANGAEVNIGKLNISFLKPSLYVANIQVTDKKKPELNTLQIEKIGASLSMDALLRAKIVVEDSSLENIQFATTRKKPGKVYKSDSTKLSNNKEIKAIKSAALKETQKANNDNAIGDLATIAEGGSGAYLDDLKANSAANEAFENLKKEIDQKQEHWEKRFKSLPQKDQIDALINKIKGTKINTKKPLQALKDVKKLNSLIKEANNVIKQYNSAQKDLRKDSKNLNNQLKSLEKSAKAELNNFKGKLNIPGLDASSLSQAIFMNIINEKFAAYRPYYEKVEAYLPPKKSKEEKMALKQKQAKAPIRMIGKNVIFPITTGYPTFWLKKLNISSKATSNINSANVKGFATNFSTHPKIVDAPAELIINADAPGMKMYGIKANLTIDHRQDDSFENLDVNIKKLPSSKMTLTKNKALSIKLLTADISTSFNLHNNSAGTKITSQTLFKNGKYDVESDKSFLKDVFNKSLNNLDTLSLNANAVGNFPKLDWSLKSNLGKEVSKNVQAEIKNKINQAQDKLRKETLGKIEAQKDEVQKKLKSFTSKYEGELNKGKQKLAKVQKDAKNKAKSGSSGTKEKGKKELKKLFKKLF